MSERRHMSSETRKKLRKLSNKLDSLHGSAERLDEAIANFETDLDEARLPEAKTLGNSKDVAWLKKMYARLRTEMWSLSRLADDIEALSADADELSRVET